MSDQPPDVVTCDECGRTESRATALLTWSSATEHGRSHRCCASCSRAHLRSIEAKLGPEHW